MSHDWVDGRLIQIAKAAVIATITMTVIENIFTNFLMKNNFFELKFTR